MSKLVLLLLVFVCFSCSKPSVLEPLVKELSIGKLPCAFDQAPTPCKLSPASATLLKGAIEAKPLTLVYNAEDEYWKKSGIVMWGVGDTPMEFSAEGSANPTLFFQNDVYALLEVDGSLYSIAKADGKMIEGVTLIHTMGNQHGNCQRSAQLDEKLKLTVKETGYAAGSAEYEFTVSYQIGDDGKFNLIDRQVKFLGETEARDGGMVGEAVGDTLAQDSTGNQ